MAQQPLDGHVLLIIEVSRSYSDTPHSAGLLCDERSARRRDLHLITHNTHKRKTSMPQVGFEPVLSASERSETHTLDARLRNQLPVDLMLVIWPIGQLETVVLLKTLYYIVWYGSAANAPVALQLKAYCTNLGLYSFLLAPPVVSTRDPSSRELAGNFDAYTFLVPLHAADMRHGTNGFTFLPKEFVLRIFEPWKIPRLRPGLNPRSWVPKASTLHVDHRSRFKHANCIIQNETKNEK